MRTSHRQALVAVLTASFWCSLLALASAQQSSSALPPSSPEMLGARIRDRVASAGLGDAVGISVVDVRTGQSLFAHNAAEPLNPASNQKLVTAAVALLELGPAFRMRTGLYGQVEGDSIRGGLWLRGFGDPTLRSADLVAMAQELVARGVSKVDEVIVDGSYFDDRVLPPAFEQQPNEVAPFRAPIGAVCVEGSAYTLRVAPGRGDGSPARVTLDGEGYFDVTNTITTRAGGPLQVIADQTAKDDRMLLRLSGSVPLGTGMVSYRRRVESPLPFAGHALIDALRALRVQVPRRVRIATTPKGTALLVSRQSPPLAHILAALGKDSDNFVAEMVFKTLAAERVKTPARSEDAAAFVTKTLARLGVPTANLAIVNGSGLFHGNRIAASHLTQLLTAMHADSRVRAEYIGQLAIGGIDGTLSGRFEQLPAPGIVRAKTGTLNDVIALSGYVLGRAPDQAVAFSVLANGVAGKGHAARAMADQIVTDIAQYLWAPPNN